MHTQYWRHISAQHVVDLCSKLIGHNSFSVLVLHFHLLRVARWALSHWTILWFALRLVHQSKSFKASLTVMPLAEAKEKKRKKKLPIFGGTFAPSFGMLGESTIPGQKHLFQKTNKQKNRNIIAELTFSLTRRVPQGFPQAGLTLASKLSFRFQGWK